jgi:GDP-4-dehydro-6-deoxy-D-mannose reductase
MKKVLITGATGFVGNHLTDHLLSLGDYEIYGTTRSAPDQLQQKEHLTYTNLDLQDKAAVQQILSDIKPELLFAVKCPAEYKRSY